MRPERRRRILLVVAACCIGVLVLDALVLRPLFAAWDDQSGRIAQAAQDIERGTALVEREEAIRTRWQGMKDASLPKDTGKAESMVLEAIAEWSSRSGLDIAGIRPRWVAMRGVGDRMEVRLTAEGSMAAVARFLYELETSALPISLEDTQIRARDDDGRRLGVELVFSGLRIGGTEP